ncbi:MAG: ABC transporter ATP-binding protein [Dehalococcoidia bacterium]|nr:ABC transporter ATP-binding protein [Dehalococcoidia bacterium]
MSTPDAAPILVVDDVTKAFGGVRAVNGCSLTVSGGSITGLIGPNGAGKTTLFNLITGFLKPTSGRISFRGTRIDGLPPHAIFQKGIVRTFQIPRELKSMTLLENLMLVPPAQSGERIWNPWFFAWRVSRQEEAIFAKAMQVLEFVDMLHLRDEYAANLSGGQKKLLELARTLMCNPQLILLDEPGAGVNRVLMKKLVTDIERLRRELNITFFLIEHDMDLITRLCDTVIVMSEGAKLAEGSAEEVKADARVLEAYLGGQYR